MGVSGIGNRCIPLYGVLYVVLHRTSTEYYLKLQGSGNMDIYNKVGLRKWSGAWERAFQEFLGGI